MTFQLLQYVLDSYILAAYLSLYVHVGLIFICLDNGFPEEGIELHIPKR